ncbi:hypothetical protein QVD17_22542 [Tagetes erecta]|uniref:DC1 domain-containing protein n=1 Tax=Tagetes erecta TaxID=13708 RepID=A0AAD8KDH2_TARER|nr:hypothetical protein QVD17_22542 [Tagetes erecta]
MSNSWSCHACLTKHRDGGVGYQCCTCPYEIDLRCVTFAERTVIHHPGHSHPLIPITNDPTLSKCYSCGKEHKGVFYHCFTCFNFSIHNDCVNLPFKLTLAYHVHKLTLSYSFTIIPYYSKCRICQKSISETVWLYKCSKCRYYVHIDCAASSSKPFMFLSRGGSDANFKAADYPDLVHYPLLDESYNMLPRHIQRGNFQGFDEIIFENDIPKHPSHQHPLLLIKSPNYTAATHDPDKRIKLSEQDVNSVHNREGVCHFLNMKFEGIVHFRDHEHVLLILVGTESDGDCCVCRGELRSFAMFKCSQCEDAFHVKCGMSWYGIKIRGMSSFTNIARPKPKEVKKHLSAITFYPCEVTRPIPWQPKDIDGQS